MLDMQIKKEEYLSSGCTLLNLAASNTPYGAVAKGKYFWMVGDSASGKTFLTLGMLAEACINKNFDAYDLVYDNVEDGALMDIDRYFGAKLAERIQPPGMEDGAPVFSRDVEDFYFGLDDRLDLVSKGKRPPFVYLLDSMDALSSKYEGQKFQEKKTAAAKGTKAKGDYGDGKAKINSTWIRRLLGRLQDSESILIILSQTRDKIDAGMFEPSQTHAGGRALKFYASWELWSSVGPALTRTYKGKDRQLGIVSRLQFKKNRLNGKLWRVDIPIYHSYGIDNVGACVDFLVNEKWWKKSKEGVITATDLDVTGSRDDVIRYVEDNDLEFDLDQLVVEAWRGIENACRVSRKRRYT